MPDDLSEPEVRPIFEIPGYSLPELAAQGDESVPPQVLTSAEAERARSRILFGSSGLYLQVDDEPAEDDAWYDFQLVGLRALRDGVEVGTIVRVDHLPAQDLLAVRTPQGEVLVPFVGAIVPVVDIVAGTVTLTPPLGLFEELPDAPDEASAEDESKDARA